MTEYKVTFLPDNVTARIEAGSSLIAAAGQAGIELKSTCGRKGTCGRCAVRVREGRVRGGGGNVPARLQGGGYVLACQAFVAGPLVVEVPVESRMADHHVLLAAANAGDAGDDSSSGYQFEPVCQKLHLELPQPSTSDNAGDLDRLKSALRRRGFHQQVQVGLGTLRQLAEVLRAAGWRSTVTLGGTEEVVELLAVEPGLASLNNYGLAIDIGTTTVAICLVDLQTGLTVDQSGTYNRQARYGDDVTSRIIHAGEFRDGTAQLHTAIIDTINDLVTGLLNRSRVPPPDINAVVAAGNTTMTHLFLGLSPQYIRLEPYIPVANNFPVVRAGELGLAVNPGAWVLSLPAVAGYVGGDVVAGILATGMAGEEPLTLFIDIGTNGEMVLGNREWLVSCACSAGPAFEGGGITFGTRAMKGAIERATINPETFEVAVEVLGGGRPTGICGSGLIDLLAGMRRVGLIDRSGGFNKGIKTPRLRATADGEDEFVVVWSGEAAGGKDIVVTQGDIKTLIRAKGAVYAGIRCLLGAVGLEIDSIERVLIAGGFGSCLNVPAAIEIGLLPDLPPAKFRFVGNTAIKGARAVLLSRQALAEAGKIAARLTYMELSVGNSFMQEFVSALFLPHTDFGLFPSVRQ